MSQCGIRYGRAAPPVWRGDTVAASGVIPATAGI